MFPQDVLLEAMFGQQTFWRSVPSPSAKNSSRTLAHVFGRKRSTTRIANTTTSAVGLILTGSSGHLEMRVHHNPHAKSPLPQGLFASVGIREFIVPSLAKFERFVEISAANP